jgi:hypothetical protein
MEPKATVKDAVKVAAKEAVKGNGPRRTGPLTGPREGTIHANRPFLRRRTPVVLVGVLQYRSRPTSPACEPGPAAFGEFTERVQQYVKLQKAMPRLRSTKHRKEIVERRHALAQHIRETRTSARPGDIFTPEAAAEFRRVIRIAFQGPNARSVRKTLRDGEPLSGWQLTVNGDYPEHLPMTTVPPTLLLRLPQLPEEVAYRIIGHDFVLQDTEAKDHP